LNKLAFQRGKHDFPERFFFSFLPPACKAYGSEGRSRVDPVQFFCVLRDSSPAFSGTGVRLSSFVLSWSN